MNDDNDQTTDETDDSGYVTFESPKVPGLNIVAGGNGYRFRGGVLQVSPSAAKDVRKWVAAHAGYGVTEGATRPLAFAQTNVPTNDPEGDSAPEPTMRMTKSDLAAIANNRGIPVDESMTKRDIFAALGGESSDDDDEGDND